MEDISVEMLRKALDAYIVAAYQHAPHPLTVKSRVLFIREYAGDSLADLLAHDVIERLPAENEGNGATSYSIRLGNDRYPHMKLMLTKVADDDWRFAIDCHDGVFEVISASSADHPRAEELKGYNRALRENIESHWREEDIPTVDES
jgi:hypothetical protein